MASNCRLILKRTNEDLFYKAPNVWVRTREEAVEFEDTFKVDSFCKKHRLSEVVIIMDFGDPHYDITLPVCGTSEV